ncbi:DUF4332 domain-containing protein [Phormidesmis priestleyi ULC007]|uniref:DUF4332 domain-containing protein n=1 Tax=Phormidesmis priestleyi ULC007 TaxID=1920490 RepID=A0A2T1DNK7_9CYAN|nr:DUF4332 domain-containing protein [Phormidesmis priestleyi ULC007]PZO54956.1 MAG: DUF4332 domain-containing protein [Phormidesmis priestleyi]
MSKINWGIFVKTTSADWSIDQLPGLSTDDHSRLITCGIHTTLQLLQQGKTPEKRGILASQLQIPIRHVNKWVALADLARIPGVGCQYCGLLLHAGVASPTQLARTPLDRLHRQMLKLQVATLQRRDLCPAIGEVEQWSQQARVLS